MDYMGFEGKILQGAAGSEATGEIENSRDITYGLDHEKGETTVRGDGSVPPMKTERVAARVASIEFEMTVVEGDSNLTDLLTAAAIGGPIAIRTKHKDSGKGFDGDCTVTWSHGKPLKGEQTIK
ncbi:MAG TPA: hypothetical protein VJ809_03610, partial [Pirellulales bacterium]|nr:hypothetical protein [Pirellulales bacterium]